MWPFSRRLNQSPIPAYIAFALSVLLGATLLVPTPGFSTTPAVGVGDVTTAMWYETNVDAISAADSDDTDRIIGTPITAITRRDDEDSTVAPAWPMNFFGTKYEGLCVTTNGTVSPVATSTTSCSDNYDQGLSQLSIAASAPLIAAFANDVNGSKRVLPSLGGSITTARFAAADSGSRTLTVTTRSNHGLTSGASNVCVMFTSPSINNGASATLWRTDEFWFCGDALNASSTEFEMSVPLTFSKGEDMDITNITTSPIAPLFSRVYVSNSTALNATVDNTSYTSSRGYDGFGHLSSIYYGTATIRGQDAMVITWYRHAQHSDDNAQALWNTFQIVLVKKPTTNGSTVGFDFDFEFNYGTIQDGDDGYSGSNPNSSCSSMSADCRTGVGVADFNAGTPTVYELFPDTSSRDLVDWGTTTSLTANSLNATVNGVTTLGRYGFTFTGGAPSNFATPVMDGSGQVVGGSAASTPANPSEVYLGPITLSLTPAKVPASGDISVAINGRRLADVTAVFVGNLKAEIVSRKGTELIFKRPALTPSRYVIRVVSNLGEFTFDGLVVGAGESSTPQPARTTVSGFVTGSSRLTSAMRAALRQAVATVPRAARVTCQGSTSGPISLPRDQILANRRSEVACAFIARIRPDLATEALKGKPDNRRSAELRNVQIRIIG